MDRCEPFRGKKITVMGLGLLGRGVGDIRYLASCGAELIVTDAKSAEALAPSIEALKDVPGIAYVLGEHRLEDFSGRDLIVKAAGIPLDSPYIAKAREEGTPVRMSADLFAEISGVPVIGITGTRGKSTVTHMLSEIFAAAGRKALLGGNVRGVSTLSLLAGVTPEHTAILELDSWQLQGFGEAKRSPHIAVFTTFFPDHLNYYHDDLDSYLADKANIFLFQKPGDTLVLGSQCAGLIQSKYADHIQGWTSLVGSADLPNDWKLQIPGEHNRYNAALALSAARAAGIEDVASRRGLEAFKGVEGRLEFLQEIEGVKVYNDNNATTPDATLAALTALGETHKGRIVLIMGGADKGIDMTTLLQAIPEYSKYVALLSGTGTERVRATVSDAPVFDDLAAAWNDAKAHAIAGDVILFSPAFASFGMFNNEYDRSDQFVALVRSGGI